MPLSRMKLGPCRSLQKKSIHSCDHDYNELELIEWTRDQEWYINLQVLKSRDLGHYMLHGVRAEKTSFKSMKVHLLNQAFLNKINLIAVFPCPI